MKHIILIILSTIIYSKSFSQVGIGTTNVHNSAVLQLDSDSKGFLLPRMTRVQRDNIANPAEGLMIYNISHTSIEFYNTTEMIWIPTSTPNEVIQDLAPANLNPPCVNTNSNYIVLNNNKYGSIADLWHNGGITHTGGPNNSSSITINHSVRVDHSTYFRGFLKFNISDWTSGDITGRMYYNPTSDNTNYLRLHLMDDNVYSAANNWNETNMTANRAHVLGFPLFLNSSSLHASNDLITSINTSSNYFEFTIPENVVQSLNQDSITLRLQQENGNHLTASPVNPKRTVLYANYPARTNISFTGTNNGIEGPYELVDINTNTVIVDNIANVNNGLINLADVQLKVNNYDPSVYSGSTTFSLRLRSKAHPSIFISNTVNVEAAPCY